MTECSPGENSTTGYNQAADGTDVACSICPAGTFQTAYKSTSCTACPAGKTTCDPSVATTGSGPGCTAESHDEATDCFAVRLTENTPAMTECSPGENSTTGYNQAADGTDVACSICPAGTFQ